jgi:hypothetical protein
VSGVPLKLIRSARPARPFKEAFTPEQERARHREVLRRRIRNLNREAVEEGRFLAWLEDRAERLTKDQHKRNREIAAAKVELAKLGWPWVEGVDDHAGTRNE